VSLTTFKHIGDVIDYTPSSALSAGEIVVEQDLIGQVVNDIAANEPGSLRIEGIINAPKLSTDVVAIGDVLYWDAGNSRCTKTASTHKMIGVASQASANGNSRVFAKLTPQYAGDVSPTIELSVVAYFSKSTGDDSNPGTEAEPYETIAKANEVFATLSPGEAIALKRGDTWTGETLTPNNIGTVGSPVGIVAYGSGAKPIINANGQTAGISTDPTANYCRFENLEVIEADGTCISIRGGYHTFIDCNSRDAGPNSGAQCWNIQPGVVTVDGGETSGGLDDGFSGHSGELILRNHKIFGCDQAVNTLAGFKFTIEDCWMIGEGLSLIAAATGDYTVRRTRFQGKPGGGGSRVTYAGDLEYCVFDASLGGQNDLRLAVTAGGTLNVRNCVFWGGDDGTKRGDVYVEDRTMNVTNCAFVNWYRHAYIQAGGTLTNTNCLFFGTTIRSTTNTTHIDEITSGDPLLTDPENDDWSVGSGSPLIDAGTDLGLTADYESNAVSDPPYAGAVNRTA
jgi:predicted RecA/RadA family phage recombinase